ncbi:peptidoglycan editing factor PgeF [Pseudidiomarina sp. CB1]|uniref:peptidoglycan editing factor PgeF n=1 Tax=Pseudidiomarina sp. CB1 TaxID=2972484 RepID=UPI002162E36E|nr:peptidoglycan editing factor PgeF [Pseudidiomarina sp. CB1]
MATTNVTNRAFGIVPEWRLPNGVQARVTTVDEPGNLAVHVGDDPARVIRHRRLLQRQLALPVAPKWLAQYHSANIVRYENCRAGVAADAIWAQSTPSVCAVLTADCLPILMVSDDGEVIAAIHAGWRGLVSGVVKHTVEALPKLPQQLHAYIGPAITREHFQVGADVYQAFAQHGLADNATFSPQTQQKWLADLPLLAERVLQGCGVEHVTQSGLCTYSDPRFSSHRENPAAGRIASLIWKS